jgi:hypothetical protein
MPTGFSPAPRAGHGVRCPGLLRTRTAGSDSGKATTSSCVMRRGPFHHHHQPARLPNRLRPSTPLILPSGDPWYLFATLANRRHACASLARVVRCYRLYGDIMVNLRRTGNCLARERAVSNEVVKNRSVTPNLTLSSTREPFHEARQYPSASCMRAANGHPLRRAQPRRAGAAASKVQWLKRGWRLPHLARTRRRSTTRMAWGAS